MLLALCSTLIGQSLRGGLVVAGSLNLSGSVDPPYDPVVTAELAYEKGASTLLAPLFAQRSLFDLSDDVVARLDIQFYADV